MYSKLDLLNLYNDADFYDAEFKDRSVEFNFYKELCGGVDNVLEVACGTGRITIPLAKSGIDITGTDISEDVIINARKNAVAAGVDMKFSVEDALFTKGSYDLIFIATNAFQHLLSFEDALTFLKACRHSLLPNGRVVIDLQVPNVEKLSRKYSEVRPYKTFTYLGNKVVANLRGCYDNLTQLYRFDIEYNQSQEVIKKKKVAMRMYYPQELRLLFNTAGLSIIQEYGDYNKSKLMSSSNKQIYVLEKLWHINQNN